MSCGPRDHAFWQPYPSSFFFFIGRAAEKEISMQACGRSAGDEAGAIVTSLAPDLQVENIGPYLAGFDRFGIVAFGVLPVWVAGKAGIRCRRRDSRCWDSARPKLQPFRKVVTLGGGSVQPQTGQGEMMGQARLCFYVSWEAGSSPTKTGGAAGADVLVDVHADVWLRFRRRFSSDF